MRESIDLETGEVMDTLASPMGGAQSPGRTAGDLISAGSQILQIRTKNQLMVAIQRPRDMKKFETQLLASAAHAGEDFFYSIPFKEHKPGCQNRRSCDCPKTYVEGPGVGLTRMAAQLWGNCSVDTRIEQETDSAFLVRSDFVDFETNYTRSETKRVSKMMARSGGGYRKAADKELDLVYQQGASKVERDCVRRSLPHHIIERAFEVAKAAALQEKAPLNQQIARIIRRFGEIGVTLEMIERQLGCRFTEEAMTKAEKDGRDVCAQLRGMLTAIKGGDTTIDEAFAVPQQSQAPPAFSRAAGAIRMEDVSPPASAPAQQQPVQQPAPARAAQPSQAQPQEPAAASALW